MDKKLSITLQAFVDEAVRKTVDAANNMAKSLTQMKDNFVKNFREAQLASGAFLYGFQKMARDFLETTATFERVGVMAKFLTQNTEEARKFTDALIDMSVKTMFSTQQITELGTRILGQTRDIEKTKKMMWGLTEAVAATGGTELDLQNAQRALTQTFIKAHPALEELNKQFNNANIPVFRVLAEAISNNIVKLEGYTSAAGVTGGASKKLAAANQKAVDSFQQTVWKSEAAEKALKRVRDKYGENSEQALRAMATVDSYHQKLDKLQGTMKEYNEAQANMGKTASVAHKSVEQIMADLQDPDVLKGISGQNAAMAIAEALMWKFKGANEAMLSTWTGMVRNIKDVLDLLKISIFGLDKDLSIREGSIFYWLHLGAKKLSEYLLAHKDDIANFFDGLMRSKEGLLAIGAILTAMLSPALSVIIGRFFGLIKAATPLSLILFLIGEAIVKFIIPNFDMLKERATPAIEAVGDTIEILKNKLSDLPTYIEGKLNPFIEKFQYAKERIGQIFMGMGISGEFGTLINFFSTMSEKVDFYSKRIVQIVDENWQKLKNFLAFGGTEGGASVVQALEGIWNRIKPIKDNLQPLFDQMSAQFALTGQIIQTQVKPAFDALIEVMKPFWEVFKPALFQFVTEVIRLFAITLGAVLAVIAGVATGIMAGFANALPYVAQALEGLIQFLRGFIQFVTGILKGDWGLALEGFMQMAKGAYDFVVNTFLSIQKFLRGFIKGVINFFIGLYNALIGKSIIPDMLNAIVNAFVNFKDLVLEKIEGLITGITDKFTNLINQAVGWGKDLINNWVNGLKSAANVLPSGLYNKAKEWLGWEGQHGGIIPGAIGQPVPILAHGGERIVPRGGSSQFANMGIGTGVTINMTGTVVLDSEDRVREMADRIIRILGRQNELARYGTGFSFI